MKKLKKIVVPCIALMFIFLLSACGEGAVTQGVNNLDGGTFSMEEIQDDPASYMGVITLIGVVGDSNTQDFALQTEAETFEVLVDYRGNQALPQVGDAIVVEGELRENRPCCGPGFTIRSTQFEAAE